MGFKNKYKAPLIVCIGALLTGVISFFITVKVYDNNFEENLPKVNENETLVSYDEENNIFVSELDSSEIIENSKPANEIISQGGEITHNGNLDEEIKVPEIDIEEYSELINIIAKNEENLIETNANIKKESGEKIIKKLEFEIPFSGEIGLDYAVEKLIYSNTLEEWVTHNGIDIIGEEASPVKAIESGIIESVKMDPRYGNTIIIKHNDEYKSIYSNLSTTDLVYVGKKIEKGEIISGVGIGFGFESNEKPHIHLTILKNGENINPLDIIKF